MRPLSVLTGEAGTGKTTVIRALIKAAKRCHGGRFLSYRTPLPQGRLLTGSERSLKDEVLRGHVEVATLHSFLAKRLA